MKFKACATRETAVYYSVNEDFEGKYNAKIRFLFAYPFFVKQKKITYLCRLQACVYTRVQPNYA